MYQKRNDIITLDHIPKLIENRVVDKERYKDWDERMSVWLISFHRRKERKEAIEKIFK
jgi:hypothetical protein